MELSVKIFEGKAPKASKKKTAIVEYFSPFFPRNFFRCNYCRTLRQKFFRLTPSSLPGGQFGADEITIAKCDGDALALKFKTDCVDCPAHSTCDGSPRAGRAGPPIAGRLRCWRFHDEDILALACNQCGQRGEQAVLFCVDAPWSVQPTLCWPFWLSSRYTLELHGQYDPPI